MYNVSTTTVNQPAKRQARKRAASSRANLRIDPRVKSVIRQAAKLKNVNFTAFMINSSQVAAEMVLAERTRFVLPPRQWREFLAALDAPPRDIPALRELFNEPSVFEPAGPAPASA